MSLGAPATLVNPGSFVRADAFYPQVLDSAPHRDVERFFGLARRDIIERYCERHPSTDAIELNRVLTQRCRHLMWAGSDLLLVTSPGVSRQMIVLETNSCPSGQKSMPPLVSRDHHRGYLRLAQALFDPEDVGTTAVVYDKNPMEASGYARTLADHLQRPVLLARLAADDPQAPVRFQGGVMQVLDPHGRWQDVDRALRYVTQRPWTRLPLDAETAIVNPVLACLGGGRNKLVAHKAYQRLNSTLRGTGLEVRTPITVTDVELAQVGDLVAALGGRAVVKIPYSNAGQGIHIITDAAALAAFHARPHAYQRFVVQELIDDAQTSTELAHRRVHVGTGADGRGRRFAFDLRMLVCGGVRGFEPLGAYARRARDPLGSVSSARARLATNLSERDPAGGWIVDDTRLIPLDTAGYTSLGLTLDDLIDAYVQTVLSVWAIEQMSRSLLDGSGAFDQGAFCAVNGDGALLAELATASAELAGSPC